MLASIALREPITKEMPAIPCKHLFALLRMKSSGSSRKVMETPANEDIMSTIDVTPRARQTAPNAASGFSIPVVVS